MIFDLDKVYTSRSGLNHSRLFFYEIKFFSEEYVQSKKEWMENNWHMSMVYAAVYIMAIFGGQAYMKQRERYDLRRCLIAWNLVLAIFSITGAVRTWPEFYNTLTTRGVEHSICSNDYTHGVSGCWAWLFILSKVPELVDTLFIVARKQQLIFLHWYHHATVLIYCWYSCKDFSSSGRWFVIMNYTVHAVMYSYYALRAMRFNIPKWVNMTITTGQISQMIIGIYVNCVAYSKRQRGEECHVTDSNIMWSFIMYFSYFVLFFHFFYKSYISAAAKKEISRSEMKKQPYTNGHATAVKSNNHVYQNGSSSSTAVYANGHTKKAQ